MQVGRYGLLIFASGLLSSCGSPEPEPELYPDSLFENLPSSDSGAIADLQGRWVSEDNITREIEIAGSDFVRFDEGTEQSRDPMVFVKDCTSGEADPDGGAFVIREADDRPCFIMDMVTEDKLSFINGKRGRVSRFTRKAEE
ncbi:MAG: hypothetical protein AAGE37_04300 [Pseudomonadota bacterium]